MEGQGSDAEFSGVKNFFRFRISPFVSGAVYTAYSTLGSADVLVTKNGGHLIVCLYKTAYYVIRTLLISRPDRDAENGSQTTRSSFPGQNIEQSWRFRNLV